MKVSKEFMDFFLWNFIDDGNRHTFRGTGERGNAPVRIDFFPRNLYSKAIGLRHVGPHALDRDLSQVFKNMCFDPKRSFVAACGAFKPQKTACFWCAKTKLYMFIDLVQIILPSKSRLRDLHKTTTESSLWENYIFWEKVKIMVLMIFLRNLGKKEIWKIMSSGWKIPFF